jgi:hypothetical protein
VKRIFLGIYAALLTLTVIFYCQITGFILKTAVKLHSGVELSYKAIHFEKGHLILGEVSAVKNQIYSLKTEKISIGFHWATGFTFQAHQPELLVSSQLLNPSSDSMNGKLSWAIDVDEGTLHWMDSVLPPGRFSFHKSLGQTELSIALDEGSLSLCNSLISCEHVPLELLSKIAAFSGHPLPIDSCNGICSARYNGDFLHVEGNDISFQFADIHCSGSGSLDWGKPDKFSSFPSRFRLKLDQGSIVTPLTSMKDIHCLATFRAGEWGMCELSAICGAHPLSITGKGFFASDHQGWASADLQLGSCKTALRWAEEEGVISWSGLNHEVGTFIQNLGHSVDPRVKKVDWVSGTVQGVAHFKDKLTLTSVVAEDLLFKTEPVQISCKHLSLIDGNWQSQGGMLNGFPCDGLWSGAKNELSVVGSWEGVPSFISWNQNGSTRGKLGECQFSGQVHPSISSLSVVIDQIEGKIPDHPFFQGTVVTGNASLNIDYGNSFKVKDWSVNCQVINGLLPDWNFSEVAFNLIADSSVVDLSGSGAYTFKNGMKVLLNAPSLRIAGENAFFDIRLENEHWDFLRAVGTKTGSIVSIRSDKSHLFGSKVSVSDLLLDGETLSKGRIQTSLQWPVISLFLEKAGLMPTIPIPFDEIQVDGYFDRNKHLGVCLYAGGWTARAESHKKLWKLSAINNEISASCDLFTGASSLFQLKKGIVKYRDLLSFDFEGKVFENFSANLLLNNLDGQAKLLEVNGLEGSFKGYGCINWNHGIIESDLDIDPTSLSWNDWQFESSDPVHLFCSSENGILVKGLEGRLSSSHLEARAKIDLIEYNKPSKRWIVQRGAFHFPSDILLELSSSIGNGIDLGREVDIEGDFSFLSDLKEINGSIKRGVISILGQPRQIKDFTFAFVPNHWISTASIMHRDKWAQVHADIHSETNIRGTVSLQEGAQRPMAVRWSYDSLGLSIHAIDGCFGGVDASFYTTESCLSGRAGVDFKQLCNWIPADVAEGIKEAGLGSGFELKGDLFLNSKDLANFGFKGILTGKQAELFGFEFRTLMAKTEISPDKIRIHDMKLCDSSLSASVDELVLQSKNNEPWTIQIPSLLIEELRPSLLKKPGEKAKSTNPLIVRQFVMKNFNGILSEGSTYKATGNLSFINTFKREETFFDLPSNIFGRIVGIDLDLLVPVIGELSFDLKDGFFDLKELTNAYSEGKRSEFFLVDSASEPLQRVDLKGNIQILVKMKQFVLFTLTEGFMISIDGNLSNPHVRLQKK